MFNVLVAHSENCCKDLTKEAIMTTVEEKPKTGTERLSVMLADSKGGQQEALSSGCDLSPLSSDSGQESAVSTPAAAPTPTADADTPSSTPDDLHQNTQRAEDGENMTDEDGEEGMSASMLASMEELASSAAECTYRLKISAPGIEPFDIQMGAQEIVQELHQVLLERENTSQRTCFTIQLDGAVLDHFTELKSVPGIRDGAHLRVVEEPYTIREARIHLRHVRDLIYSLDTNNAIAGIDGASLSFVAAVAADANQDRRKSLADRQVDCTPPDFVLPGATGRPLAPLQPDAAVAAANKCLKSLAVSQWNPPPGNRKLRGDIMYLVVQTLEGRRYHVTCCTKGFYVNQSSSDEFDPKPSNAKFVFHSLIELLNHMSASFKRNFATVQKRRTQRQIYERLPTPYQVYSWTAVPGENTMDGVRAEESTQPHRLGLEDHIPGQIRDWNEELQTTHELPRKTLGERLIRERALFKVHSDFVAASIRGAVAVVDGNVMAINPADDPKTHMFIWNNIFFSLGFDVKDHYAALGGDAAAFVAPAADLQGLKAYAALDLEKVRTLGMVVVDYRGYRVTAQSIIPGILEREQEQSVVYGSVDFGKTVVSNGEYGELLASSATQLKVLPHSVKTGDESGSVVTLYSSFETKGIVGNDSRHYVLDLLRTFPPDVNYLAEADDVGESCRSLGYPLPHPHRLAALRPELVEAFIESRYVTFVQLAAFHLQQSRLLQLSHEKPMVEEVDKSDQEVPRLTNGVGNEGQTDFNRFSTDSGVALESSDSQVVPEVVCNGHDTTLQRSEIREEDRARIAKQIKDQILSAKDGGSRGQSVNGESNEGCQQSYDEATQKTKELIREAARAVGSLSDNEFDIRFNPDCYCDGVVHAETEDLERQRRLVRDAAQFLVIHQIPTFVRECLEQSTSPLDGAGLTDALHSRGINVRYLGRLIRCLDDLPLPADHYIRALCLSEVLCRAARHLFRGYLQSVGAASLAAAVAHWLNCLLSAHCVGPPASPQADEITAVRRANKGKGRQQQQPAAVGAAQRHHSGQSGSGKDADGSARKSASQDSADWTQLTSKSLWSQLSAELHGYYAHTVDAELESADAYLLAGGVEKQALLRRFCIMTGVQLVLRDFALTDRLPFTDADINALFPVAKHINPRASDARTWLSSGQAKVQSGQLKGGFEMVGEALNLMNNVYGAMHTEIGQCMRLLARLAYILGDPQEALCQQLKAAQMTERCLSFDNALAVFEYVHLAHFSFANLQVTTALKLLYRARHLMLVIHGENHPVLAQIDGNIGVVLYAVQEYDHAAKFLQSSLDLHKRYFGADSLKTAMLFHLNARTQSFRGDFRAALQFEKETFGIYRSRLGEAHEKTRESGECLRQMTQQAVTFQRRVNEATTRNVSSIAQLMPIQMQQPTLQSILEVLNILNGIILIPYGGRGGSDEGEAMGCGVTTIFFPAAVQQLSGKGAPPVDDSSPTGMVEEPVD